MTGKRPPELDTPAAPRAYAHLVPLFHEAAAGRQGGFGSPQPLTWIDLDAFARLTGTVLPAHEWVLIKMLDAEWLSAWREAQPKADKAPRR